MRPGRLRWRVWQREFGLAPDARAGAAETAFIDLPAWQDRRTQTLRQAAGDTCVPHDAVRRRPPGALTHAHGTRVAQPVDELDGLPGREHATLRRCEPAPRDTLYLPQGGPEPREVSFGERGQELHEHEMRDPLHVP